MRILLNRAWDNNVGRTSYTTKVYIVGIMYIVDIVYILSYDKNTKGDDRYVDGTGYNSKKRMERGLRWCYP